MGLEPIESGAELNDSVPKQDTSVPTDINCSNQEFNNSDSTDTKLSIYNDTPDSFADSILDSVDTMIKSATKCVRENVTMETVQNVAPLIISLFSVWEVCNRLEDGTEEDILSFDLPFPMSGQ